MTKSQASMAGADGSVQDCKTHPAPHGGGSRSISGSTVVRVVADGVVIWSAAPLLDVQRFRGMSRVDRKALEFQLRETGSGQIVTERHEPVYVVEVVRPKEAVVA
jgi:hypothetical protein